MSIRTYKFLGESQLLLHRIEYAKRVKEDVAMTARVIAMAERMNIIVDELKKLQCEMKERLAEYDVYRQKSAYTCWRCKEVQCICEETKQ